MRILLFASIAEIIGHAEITLHEIKNTEELKQQLFDEYPSISGLNFSIAVNKSIVNRNTTLTESDEVALLPPFSGG
jgi:molybdopterin converting factor subunit 1